MVLIILSRDSKVLDQATSLLQTKILVLDTSLPIRTLACLSTLPLVTTDSNLLRVSTLPVAMVEDLWLTDTVMLSRDCLLKMLFTND